MKRIKDFFVGNKYGLSLIVIAFAIAICLLTGTTYGLWKLNFTQTTPNVVSTACFDMTFTELTPSVNLQNAYPISDAQGLETTPYTFKITNTCTQYGTYVIRLDILNTSTMSADKIKVQLEGASSISPTNLNSLETNSLLEPGISLSKVILTDSLYAQEEKEYSLRIWIDSTAGNEVMNQQFSGRLVIDTVATEEPCTNCGTLKVSETNPGETSKFLNSPSPVLRNNIESIVFADHKTVPGTSLGSWDASATQDNSVVAWYEDTDTDSRYEVTIGSTGGVKGNTNSSNLFWNICNLDNIDLTHFYAHEVTNMDRMFQKVAYNSTVLTLVLGNNFDTSSVTSMVQMFYQTGYNSPNFTLDLGDKFDTSNVTNMGAMFCDTGRSSTILTLDLGNEFDTSNVTNMSGMFASTGGSNPNFTLDLGDKFDTSKVTEMYQMFHSTGHASTVFTLDLGSKFDTSNVTNMSGMFQSVGYNSSSFTLELGDKFNTSKVTDMSYMFSSTGRISTSFTLYLGDKFDTSSVTDMSGMFRYTGYSNPNFILDLRNFNVSAVTTTDVDTFKTGKTTHKLYASASNISFMSGKGFTGTIINCTTTPASCS